MQKPFLTCHKRHNPRGFEILNFSIFLLYIISTQTTYFNKKLHKLRRLLVESDFPFVNVFTPCILLAVPRKTAVSRRYENDAQYSKQLSIKVFSFICKASKTTESAFSMLLRVNYGVNADSFFYVKEDLQALRY